MKTELISFTAAAELLRSGARVTRKDFWRDHTENGAPLWWLGVDGDDFHVTSEAGFVAPFNPASHGPDALDFMAVPAGDHCMSAIPRVSTQGGGGHGEE